MSRRRTAREVARLATRPPKEGDVVSWFEETEDGAQATCSATVEWAGDGKVQVTSPVDGAVVLMPVGDVALGRAAPAGRRATGAAAVAAQAAAAVARAARAAYGGARRGVASMVEAAGRR